jgi:hypothetical protein
MGDNNIEYIFKQVNTYAVGDVFNHPGTKIAIGDFKTAT